MKPGSSPEHATLLPHLVISHGPLWSVFHKSLHPWLSCFPPAVRHSFFFPNRDLALFFCFSTESSLALGGKSQGTERQLNTNSTSRQSSLWKLLLGHLPAYQTLWLNSSAFVLAISVLIKYKVSNSSVKLVSSLHRPLVFMPLLTSLLASTSRVINTDESLPDHINSFSNQNTDIFPNLPKASYIPFLFITSKPVLFPFSSIAPYLKSFHPSTLRFWNFLPFFSTFSFSWLQILPVFLRPASFLFWL